MLVLIKIGQFTAYLKFSHLDTTSINFTCKSIRKVVYKKIIFLL